MTGFGSAAVADGPVSARAEVRSVNHRFLQVKTRLPAELAHLEPDVEAAVRKDLERGSVVVVVALQRESAALVPRIDLEVARAYRDRLDELAAELGIERAIGLDLLIGLPGVLGSPSDGASREKEGELALRAIEGAIGALVRMRADEGASLAEELGRIVASIDALVAKLEKRVPTVVRAHHRSLVERVGTLLEQGGGASRGPTSSPIARADLAREVALIADRMDVSEEFARLKSHLDQWKKLVARGKTVGRQLDFLVQELLRETNTIGSKCADARLAHGVVELKTWIERLREQVQNVE